ncbi:phosphatidylinositol-glycan-specific phospholipase D isoform X2 [Pipistrellus kuhlii]|uniref:phosphatidylinositol-glycan-specific phospholipase D isoform X2 n=1 Tax=Pipistrellus kuhlii TaxID=59472 RepID=UPI001E274A7B|nr:phosphatidylinositol-glycan-specific phospholipase D isoform X2 [Pipistrellus kuhlii]
MEGCSRDSTGRCALGPGFESTASGPGPAPSPAPAPRGPSWLGRQESGPTAGALGTQGREQAWPLLCNPHECQPLLPNSDEKPPRLVLLRRIRQRPRDGMLGGDRMLGPAAPGRVWAGLLLALGALCPGGSPCGVSTHIEIGHRALEFLHLQEGSVNYRQLLLEHRDAYQAGTVFPDAFYPGICQRGRYHEVSESTHWTPFLNASVHYIRGRYPPPWDKDTEKLVAFLFGVTSHMVADVSWHSLGIEQGFLRTMAAMDFHGSYSEAHPAGDFGGDVLSQFEFNFNYLARRWYVPVEDLLGIYRTLYGRDAIPKHVIVECSYLQFLGMYGEVMAVSKLYPTFARKSPFLVEHFQDYFLGGLDDMAFWSTRIYRLTSHMLAHGTRDCSLPENPLFISCGGTRPRPPGSLAQRSTFQRNLTSALSAHAGRHVNYTARGAVFSVGSWTSDSLTSVYQALERNLRTLLTGSPRRPRKHASSPLASYFVSCPYARLGWAMTSADLNQDGHGDLVVGAPGYSRPGLVHVGRVYLLYGNDLGLPPVDLDLDSEAHGVLEGSQPAGRFGSALAVLDFNRDGLPDLAVGAPSTGSEQLTYKGAVYVYFGSKSGKLSPAPAVSVSCQDTYCNLGWRLLAADVDGDGAPDLVLGAPFAPGGGKQRGMVAAFRSGPGRRHGDKLTVEAADWRVQGEEDFSWLGYSLHAAPLGNRTLLLAGSPTWKNSSSLGRRFRSQDEKQSLGRVDGYFPPGRQSAFSIAGDQAMGKLGTSLSSGHVLVRGARTPVLLVGAPTHDDVSKMAFLTMTLHQGGATRMYQLGPARPTPLGSFSGDRRFCRFGGALHLSDLDGDGLDEVLVAAPLRTADVTSGLMGGEDGRVYIYNGSRSLSGDVTGKCKSWTSPCPEEKAQHVLVAPEASSRFGSGLVTVRSQDKNQVVVAAGRSSLGARLAGALHVYSLDAD